MQKTGSTYSTSGVHGHQRLRRERRVVVHLGLQQAVDACFHQTLAACARKLDSGIVILSEDGLTNDLSRYALRCARRGNVWWRWRYNHALREMVQRIDRMNFGTLLISDENLLGIEAGALFATARGADWATRVSLLDDALSDFDMTYVAYIREAEPWRVSAWSHAFEMRRENRSFETWAKTHDDLDGPARIVERLRGLLGDRLTVIDVKEETGPGKFAGRRLLELAGVSAAHLAAVVPSSVETMPAAASELLKLIYRNPKLRGERYGDLAQLFSAHPELFARDADLSDAPKHEQPRHEWATEC